MDNGQYQKLHSMVKEALSELKNLKNILSQIDYNVRVTKSKVKGFSLVELMIVVAIIGVLTAIAIPNFQSFQARSRQSEAKAALTSIYTAEQAFHSQWEVYAAPFKAIGYTPGGDYRYAAGFDAGTTNFKSLCGTATGGDLVAGTTTLKCGPAPGRTYTGEGAAAADVVTKEWNTETYCDGSHGTECDYIGPDGIDDEIDDGANDATAITVNTFRAAAIGDPLGTAACKSTAVGTCDSWQINDKKQLVHKKNQLDE